MFLLTRWETAGHKHWECFIRIYIQLIVNHMGTMPIFLLFSQLYIYIYMWEMLLFLFKVSVTSFFHLRQKLISDYPGSVGSSVALLDWTVHRPWRVWGDHLFICNIDLLWPNVVWSGTHCLLACNWFENIYAEASPCSPGQPFSSLFDGSFLCFAGGR